MLEARGSTGRDSGFALARPVHCLALGTRFNTSDMGYRKASLSATSPER